MTVFEISEQSNIMFHHEQTRREFLATTASAITATALTARRSVADFDASQRIPLGLDAHSMRGLKWKAADLIEFAADQRLDAVLKHVREGAKAAGRTYAVMYDLSGLPKGGTRIVQEDWSRHRRDQEITDDSNYQCHNGKPVVAVWGVGFHDGNKPREYTLLECRKLFSF